MGFEGCAVTYDLSGSLCVLAGSRRAIGMAARKNKVTQLYSTLEYQMGGSINLT